MSALQIGCDHLIGRFEAASGKHQPKSRTRPGESPSLATKLISRILEKIILPFVFSLWGLRIPGSFRRSQSIPTLWYALALVTPSTRQSLQIDIAGVA